LEVLHRGVHSLVRDPIQGGRADTGGCRWYRRGRVLELEETAPVSLNSAVAGMIRCRKVFDRERN
jgi:hypothetical protein